MKVFRPDADMSLDAPMTPERLLLALHSDNRIVRDKSWFTVVRQAPRKKQIQQHYWPSGWCAPQPSATSNAVTLRASRLNSTPIRWIGSSRPRYLAA